MRAIRHEFRAAVLGLTLGLGMTAPAQQTSPPRNSPEVRQNFLTGALQALQMLEERKTPLPSFRIQGMVDDIHEFYEEAGVAPQDIPEARIQAAAKRLHKLSGDAGVEKLLDIRFALDISGVRRLEKDIRRHYASAGFPIDTALENKIHEHVARAHVACANIEIENLKNLNRPTQPDRIAEEEQDIFAHLQEAGQNPDPAQQARIHAVTMRAYRASADKGLELLPASGDGEEIKQAEAIVRASYEAAGVTIDTGLEAKIRAAIISGYKNSAEETLSRMEKYHLNFSAVTLKNEDLRIRNDFAAAGTAVDDKMNRRIHAALAHASQPWIPHVQGAAAAP